MCLCDMKQIKQLEVFGQIYVSLKSCSSKSRAIWPGASWIVSEDVRIEYLIPRVAGIPDQPHILEKVRSPT